MQNQCKNDEHQDVIELFLNSQKTDLRKLKYSKPNPNIPTKLNQSQNPLTTQVFMLKQSKMKYHYQIFSTTRYQYQ